MSSPLGPRSLSVAVAVAAVLLGSTSAHAAVKSTTVGDERSDTVNLGATAKVYKQNKARADVTGVTFSADSAVGGRFSAKVRVVDHVSSGSTKVIVRGNVDGNPFKLTGTPQTGATSFGPVNSDLTCSSAARVDASATEDWITVSIPIACLPQGAKAQKLRVATTYSASGTQIASDRTSTVSVPVRD